MLETTMTVIGNLVEDPRFVIGNDGLARARFRLASTSRRRDRTSGQWVDGDTVFLTVTTWRLLAHHCHDSLRKGDRVVAHGRLRQRDWETKEGARRSDLELDADACGPDLGRAAVLIQRVHRQVAGPPVGGAAAGAAEGAAEGAAGAPSSLPAPVLAGVGAAAGTGPGPSSEPAWAVPGVPAADAA